MSEMALTADRLVVIGRGRLISMGTISEFIAESSGVFVRVQSPRIEELERLVTAGGAQAVREVDGALSVRGMSAAQVGELAGTAGIHLHELSSQMASLEEAFMEITRDSVEYHGSDSTGSRMAHDPSLVSGK
jgi:ABC-2 type transport system ATP-binding protein